MKTTLVLTIGLAIILVLLNGNYWRVTIARVGEVTVKTWMLDIGPVTRFGSIRQAVGYCGLCSAQRASDGKEQRGPISLKMQQTSADDPG